MAQPVGKPAWQEDGTAEDLRLLAWIGRSRFVTVELEAHHPGVERERSARGSHRIC